MVEAQSSITSKGTVLIDLHLHSTASDGTWTPSEVVQRAQQAGVQVMALTDHDTLAGAHEAAPEAERRGIHFLLGVELNTDAGGAEIDILGYFLQEPPVWFQEFIASRQAARVDRARAIVVRLNALGLPVRYERVRELAQGIVARPHVAQAMIEQGHATSQRDAYKRYIGFGAPAYVERDSLHPVTAMQYVKRAGGLAIVAHPGLVDDEEAVRSLVASGASGLEVYYAFHTPDQTAAWLKLARERGLLITAGSDAHGPGRAKSKDIGVAVSGDLWPALQRGLQQAWERRAPQPPVAGQEAPR